MKWFGKLRKSTCTAYHQSSVPVPGVRQRSMSKINEPRHEKTSFLYMRKTKTQISFAVTAKLISAFVSAT